MRVVMLAPFGLRPKGTLALRILPLAQMLANRGYQVSILAPSDLNPADAGRSEELEGVRVEHLPLPARTGIAGMVETAQRMLLRTLELQPQLVHLFKPKGYGAIAALLLWYLRPSLARVLDTDDWEGRGGWNDLLPYSRPIKVLVDWQERTLPRLMQAVTTASRTLQTQVWGNGVAPERVFYLPNGIRPGWRRYPERATARQQLKLDSRPTGLLYTRFWEFPVEHVVAMLAGLRARRPDFRLLVVGAGERGEERRLQVLAERAGVADLLDQRGWSDEQTILAALAAADLSIYPMSDSLINRAKAPAKLLEPMHAGLPIVAAGVGEVHEYLDYGRCGIIAEPDNAGALAQGVLRLLNDPTLSQDLRVRARHRVESVYSWERLVGVVEQAYRCALTGSERFSAAG